MAKLKKVKSQSGQIDMRKVNSFIIDLIFAFLVVSILNFIVITVFGLSPRGLLERGVETTLYEARMTVYDYVSLGYLLLLISYLAYFRKFFSLGDKFFNSKK